MMRLPRFRYLAPRTLPELTAVLADVGPDAALLAGGTDLLPSMKRRQETPAALVGLRTVPELRARSGDAIAGLTLGATTRLCELAGDGAVTGAWPALARAASLVGSPPLRNVGTLGGNLCLDTRCTYWNQTHAWRKSIGFCLKKDGDTCWVAPGSTRCWAVSSSDTAPVLCALGAEVTLASRTGERRIPVPDLFADDGIRHLTKARGEVLAAIHLPSPRPDERSVYLKLRRREAIDFPVLGVAARVRLGSGGVVEAARIFLGGVGSRPQEATAAAAFLLGRRLTDEETVTEAARLAAQVTKPLQNTDFALGWRKGAAREYVGRALRELARPR